MRTDSLTFSSDLTVSLTFLSDLIGFGTERSRKMIILGSISASKIPSASSLSGKSHPCDPSNPPETNTGLVEERPPYLPTRRTSGSADFGLGAGAGVGLELREIRSRKKAYCLS